MAIKGGEAKQLSHLFTDESGSCKYFAIPKYQRDYVWQKLHIQQLINDLEENDQGHFLGTIILCKASEGTVNEIIDGQQRLTTLSILLGCIYKKLKDLWNSFEMSDKNSYDKLCKECIREEGNIEEILISGNKPRLILSITNKNNDKYLYCLKQNGLIESDVTIPNYGNTSFSRSVKYIETSIENIIGENKTTEEKIKSLLEFSKKVSSAILAPISTDTYSDAYKLFECINNRGMELSAIDLIKNLAFKKHTSKKEDNDIDAVEKVWQGIIDNLDTVDIQARFLRHYYNAFKYKENIAQKSISKATASNVSKIYENLIKNSVDFVLEEFTQKSEIYSLLIDENNMPNELKTDLIRLKRVGLAPAYMFLLYLLSEFKDDNVLQGETVNFLVKYAFRRNLTDFPRTRNLDQMFIDLITHCESHKTQLTFELIKEFLTQEKYFSKFEDVKDQLNADLYENNSDLTRFILCEIQNKLTPSTRETAYLDVWQKKDDGKYLFEIEHVLPQNADLSKSGWADMLANGDIGKANEIRKSYTHKIGNLTLSAYNQKLGEMSFEKKRDRKDDQEQFIGYKNGLAINNDLKDEKIWNEEKILARSSKLIEHTIELYKMGEDKGIALKSLQAATL